MEEMVPELQNYVSQGYFTKEETRAIASARRDHEYRLKRKAPLLPDFLRYVEHEAAVAELVRSRRRAMPRSERPKKSIADRAGDRRIHFIYTRACRKFRGDLSLWSAWLEFCTRSGSRKRGGRVAASALALHPREPALWAAAAAWEYSGGGGGGGGGTGGEEKKRKAKDNGSNPAAARALMQRGLRACGAKSDSLWAQYLRLELAYAATLRARREILGDAGGEEKKKEQKGGGEDGSGSDNDDESESEDDDNDDDDGEPVLSDEDEERAAPPPKKKQKKTKSAVEGGAETRPTPTAEDEAEAATRAVLEGEVAAVVARSAVAADPRNLDRRLRLLSTLQGLGNGSGSDSALLTLPGARRAASELYEGLARDFSKEPRARAALARRAVAEAELCSSSSAASSFDAVPSAAALRESLAAFDAAISELPVEAMFDELVSFLKERLAKAEREESEAPTPATPATPPPAATATPTARRGQKQRQRAPPAPSPALSSSSSPAIELLNKRLERACAAAAEAGVASESVLFEWPQAALRRRRVRAALTAAERATNPSSSSSSAPSSSAAVWRARLALMGTLATAKAPTGEGEGEGEENLWDQLARATVEGATAVEAAEAEKSSAASVGAAAATAPLWKEAFSAISNASSASTSASEEANRAAASKAFEVLVSGLAASILASPCSPDPRGGLGMAAAAALAAAQALGGGEGGGGGGGGYLNITLRRRRRALADLLLSPGRPSPGGDFFDALLRIEVEEALALQREFEEENDRRRKASAAAAAAAASASAAAAAAAAAAVDRFVEAALAAPTARDDARPWLHYLRWEQERKPAGQGVGRVHWRAGKALRGEAAAEFALASSSAR